MPIERHVKCPICAKDTATATVAGVTIYHGDCWTQELRRRWQIAPPDSHIRKAIEDQVEAIKANSR